MSQDVTPANMNNVFFTHQGKLYCLCQVEDDDNFALSDVRENETLHSGPMSGLVACVCGLAGGREEKNTKRIEVHHIIAGDSTKGWVHTHGMAEIGLPELEVREVPSFLAEAAARLLQTVCRYMQEPGVVVRLGETMAVSDHTRFRFVRALPIPGEEDHYEVERWQLAEIELRCDECGLTRTEMN